MIQNVNFSDFLDTFYCFESYKNNFTYEGKQALFDYLEQYEEDTGEQVTLDIIVLCCEYTEYPTAWEAMENYQPEDMPTVDNSEGMDLIEIGEHSEQLALKWLQDHTQVIEFDKGVIILDF